MGSITTFPTQAPAIPMQGTFLAYAQIIANVNGVSGTFVAVAGLSVTVNVPAGRRIRISGHSLMTLRGAALGTLILSIWEGATRLNEDAFNCAQNELMTGNPVAIVTPSAGAHTYNLSVGATAGTVDVEASTVIPAFILVEDITNSAQPYPPASVPVGVLAQAQVVANVPLTNVSTDITSLNIVVPAGRTIRLSAHIPGLFGGSANQAMSVFFFEGATQIQQEAGYVSTGFIGGGMDLSLVFSPSAGSHTYKLVASLSTGTASIFAGTDRPIIFLAEDITATPAPANSAPSSTLGYAEVTANQTGITGANTDITGLTTTVTVPAGRRLRITAYGHALATGAPPDRFFFKIFEDGNEIAMAQSLSDSTVLNQQITVTVIKSPTAGSHTYKASLAIAGAAGTFVAGAGQAGYIIVEDITTVSTYAINPLSVQPGTFQTGNYTFPGSVSLFGPTPGANYDGIGLAKVGALSANNIWWAWSHRSNDRDLLFYGYDGTTFRNYFQFEYPTPAIKMLQLTSMENNALHLFSVGDPSHRLLYANNLWGSGDDGPHLIGYNQVTLACANGAAWSLKARSDGSVIARGSLTAGASSSINGVLSVGQGKGYGANRFHWMGDGNDLHHNWGGPYNIFVDVTNVKTFVIDHPLDPERYLVHAAVEGPEGGVFYRGQSQLVNGWVQVDLPSYFEALCAEEGRSVMLTCIADDPADEWCPVLHATYPKNGKFWVGLGSGMVINDQRFWWEVKAVRKDVAPLLVEPLKKDVIVKGEGPYLYYKEKP